MKTASINPVLRNAPLGERLSQMARLLTDSGVGTIARGALGGLAGALVEKEHDRKWQAAAGGAAMGIALPTAAKGLVSMLAEPNMTDALGVGLSGALGGLSQDDTRRPGGIAFGTTMGLALKGLMKRSEADLEAQRYGFQDAEDMQKHAGWESAVKGFANAKPFKAIGKGIDATAKAMEYGGNAGTAVRGALGAGLGYATADKDDDTGSKLIRAGLGGVAGVIAPGVVKDIKHVGQNISSAVANPAKHFRRGWQGHSPVGQLRQGAKSNEVQKRMIKATQDAKAQDLADARDPGFISRLIHGGKHQAETYRVNKVHDRYNHLLDASTNKARNVGQWAPDKGKNVVQGVADELSRRGWTGSGTGGTLGGATKYLPVGPKGLAVGFGAMAAPGVVDAARGEKDWSEVAGDVGSTIMYAGVPATAGMGLAGSMAMSSLGNAVASTPVRAVESMTGNQKNTAPQFFQSKAQKLYREVPQMINASHQSRLGTDTGIAG